MTCPQTQVDITILNPYVHAPRTTIQHLSPPPSTPASNHVMNGRGTWHGGAVAHDAFDEVGRRQTRELRATERSPLQKRAEEGEEGKEGWLVVDGDMWEGVEEEVARGWRVIWEVGEGGEGGLRPALLGRAAVLYVGGQGLEVGVGRE